MALLWERAATGELVARDLAGDAGNVGVPGVRILRSAVAAAPAWVLIADAGTSILVNGERLRTGIRVLASRDAIRGRGFGVAYFADERVPTVERFKGEAHEIACARCTSPIEVGTPAVRCPSCGHWYHEQGEMNCWTVAGVCGQCGQATDMDVAAWTPEEA